MAIEEVLNILCKKTYLVDKTNEDNIVPLYDQFYGIEMNKDYVYIIFDCDIKDGVPDVYKTDIDSLRNKSEEMGLSVEKVVDTDELSTVYGHINTFENEAKIQK